MDIKLLPLDYNIIIGISEMCITNDKTALDPIIETLVEQLNTKIKTGDIVGIWNFSYAPLWYSFKTVDCKRIVFKLHYNGNPNNLVKEKMCKILADAYPMATIWCYIEEDEFVPNKCNVEVALAFRQDGKLLKSSYI